MIKYGTVSAVNTESHTIDVETHDGLKYTAIPVFGTVVTKDMYLYPTYAVGSTVALLVVPDEPPVLLGGAGRGHIPELPYKHYTGYFNLFSEADASLYFTDKYLSLKYGKLVISPLAILKIFASSFPSSEYIFFIKGG